MGLTTELTPATGQITVGPRTILDREDGDDASDTVEVTATDPSGVATSSFTVTIDIKNVNEAPTMSAGATKISNEENTNITVG